MTTTGRQPTTAAFVRISIIGGSALSAACQTKLKKSQGPHKDLLWLCAHVWHLWGSSDSATRGSDLQRESGLWKAAENLRKLQPERHKEQNVATIIVTIKMITTITTTIAIGSKKIETSSSNHNHQYQQLQSRKAETANLPRKELRMTINTNNNKQNKQRQQTSRG